MTPKHPLLQRNHHVVPRIGGPRIEPMSQESIALLRSLVERHNVSGTLGGIGLIVAELRDAMETANEEPLFSALDQIVFELSKVKFLATRTDR